MTQVRFYHLQRQSVERALPKLLERMLEKGMRAVVRVGDEATCEHLDTALWTYDPAAFLPHGTAKSGYAERQPIYLTTGEENPNNAKALVSLGGDILEAVEHFEALFYMFDGRSEEAVAQARAQWRALQDKGADLTYWRQQDTGGWEQMT